uniref:Uncharacterized protein n=1 Tax=Anguilla anguilla TaxID=7936 RepID=A0A0E9SHC8_ANGAN
MLKTTQVIFQSNLNFNFSSVPSFPPTSSLLLCTVFV